MAIVLALLSSLMWGTADFFGGLLSKRRSSYAVVGASQIAGFVAVSGLMLFVGGFDGEYGWLPWSVLAAIVGSLGLISFYAALASGTMGVVSPIASLGGVIPVAAGLLAGERPAAIAVLGGVVALAGGVLASGPELSGKAAVKPVVLAAIAGTCFGFALLFLAYGAQYDALATLWGMRLTTTVAFLVAALATRSVGGLQWADLPALSGIGFGDAAANYLFAIATTMGFVTIVSALGSLYAVATVLLAAWILHERMQKIQVLGVALALCGVALVSGGAASA